MIIMIFGEISEYDLNLVSKEVDKEWFCPFNSVIEH
jgi:hypothetical protein